jgi:hypothetical protein
MPSVKVILWMTAKKVKLQKQKAYEYEGHAIFKYRLNIPSEIIKELEWDKENIELNVKVKDRKLEISKSLAKEQT